MKQIKRKKKLNDYRKLKVFTGRRRRMLETCIGQFHIKKNFLVFHINILVFDKTFKCPASHSYKKLYAIEINMGPLSLILTMVFFKFHPNVYLPLFQYSYGITFDFLTSLKFELIHYKEIQGFRYLSMFLV